MPGPMRRQLAGPGPGKIGLIELEEQPHKELPPPLWLASPRVPQKAVGPTLHVASPSAPQRERSSAGHPPGPTDADPQFLTHVHGAQKQVRTGRQNEPAPDPRWGLASWRRACISRAEAAAGNRPPGGAAPDELLSGPVWPSEAVGATHTRPEKTRGGKA